MLISRKLKAAWQTCVYCAGRAGEGGQPDSRGNHRHHGCHPGHSGESKSSLEDGEKRVVYALELCKFCLSLSVSVFVTHDFTLLHASKN